MTDSGNDQLARRLNVLEQELHRRHLPQSEIVAILTELFFLRQRIEVQTLLQQARDLIAQYAQELGSTSISELVANLTAYATRLAVAPGPLEYEEMHKLFALRDEIEALSSLFSVGDDIDTLDELDNNLRHRFSVQPKIAHLVAEERVDSERERLWWYETNLQDSHGLSGSG
jgi:hypothetical protein